MKVLLIGYGRMGHMLESLIEQAEDLELLAAVDENNAELLETLPRADVAIEFASPAVSPLTAAYLRRTGTPLVCGTTGYAEEQLAALKELGGVAPVIYSANYSLGIAVMAKALRDMAPVLAGFDIEIVETHHNKKADAPSGTAKLLLDAVDPAHAATPVYGREGYCGARTAGEIGLHAVRGGTVAGDHTVFFFGEDEIIEVTHRAASRAIFANGALHAARKLAKLPNGFYTLNELLFGEKA